MWLAAADESLIRASSGSTGCYVFTDNNDQGYRAAIDKDLPDILADFVYSKTVVASTWAGFGRVENFENGDASPEAAAGTVAACVGAIFMSSESQRGIPRGGDPRVPHL